MKGKTDWLKKLSPILVRADAHNQTNTNWRLLIESQSRYIDKINTLVNSVSGKIHREIGLIPSLVVELPAETIAELANSRYVKRIWHDAPVRLLLDVAVPTCGGDLAQKQGFTGSGIVVALLDTGIYPHPDLTTPNNRIFAWNDLVNQKQNPYDDNGHGTHVAGIIAGNGYSSDGKYTGMAPEARLVGVKVMDQEGAGNISTVISGIEWCISNQDSLNIRVINLSLGSTAQESYRNDPLCRATTAAWHKGILVCAAAGNEGPEQGTIDTPGINPTIITVGNIDDEATINQEDDRLNPTSSRGPTIDRLNKPDLVAPGTNITSLANTKDGYQTMSGTSMSTPLVAGAAAQIFQKNPSFRPDQVREVLLKNAKDKGLGRNLQGAGELNMAGVFNQKVETRMVHAKKIISYHLMKNVLKDLYPNSGEVQKKFDELITRTIFEILTQG